MSRVPERHHHAILRLRGHEHIHQLICLHVHQRSIGVRVHAEDARIVEVRQGIDVRKETGKIQIQTGCLVRLDFNEDDLQRHNQLETHTSSPA